MILKIYQVLDSMTLESLQALQVEIVKNGFPENFIKATDIMIEKKKQMPL